MSSVNKFGKGTENNVGKGQDIPKGTVTNGSTYRKIRKVEIGGPTNLRGHPGVSELHYLYKLQTSRNLPKTITGKNAIYMNFFHGIMWMFTMVGNATEFHQL